MYFPVSEMYDVCNFNGSIIQKLLGYKNHTESEQSCSVPERHQEQAAEDPRLCQRVSVELQSDHQGSCTSAQYYSSPRPLPAEDHCLRGTNVYICSCNQSKWFNCSEYVRTERLMLELHVNSDVSSFVESIFLHFFKQIILINRGCGSDRICQSNLHLQHKFCSKTTQNGQDVFKSLVR